MCNQQYSSTILIIYLVQRYNLYIFLFYRPTQFQRSRNSAAAHRIGEISYFFILLNFNIFSNFIYWSISDPRENDIRYVWS